MNDKLPTHTRMLDQIRMVLFEHDNDGLFDTAEAVKEIEDMLSLHAGDLKAERDALPPKGPGILQRLFPGRVM